MSMNGAGIGMMSIIIKIAQRIIRRDQVVENIPFCVAVLGAAPTITAELRIGIGTVVLAATTGTGFA